MKTEIAIEMIECVEMSTSRMDDSDGDYLAFEIMGTANIDDGKTENVKIRITEELLVSINAMVRLRKKRARNALKEKLLSAS